MWAALVLTLALQAAPHEVVTAVQIHGNTATSDEAVRRLAGVQVGMALEPTTVDEVAARLKATKRFERVDVRKRFASIADPSQIVLVIVVDEGAVRIEMTGDADHPTRVVRSHRPNLLFLPVLRSENGYGITYGARLAMPDPIGKRSRLYFPLTWGGDKRAEVELEKFIEHFPIDRILVGTSISRRINPFLEEDDARGRVWARGEREIVHGLRVGADAGWQHVSIAGATDRFSSAGADIVVDTRIDPALPRNAVFLKAGWEHLSFGDGRAEGVAGPPEGGHYQGGYQGGVNRTELDARGYLGLVGQNILALRALRMSADRRLPPYLQPLLGGMANLRGFRAGTAAGDTLVSMSAEVIVPLTSPLKIGKIGVSAFTDRGTAYNYGERFADQTLKQGYGGSLWLAAAFVRLNIAVAHGRGSSTRVQVSSNVTF